ncbi:hypothetical protein R9C00_01695 [Flammeovirgaceae bacterium SG7u.111]|nr:hypothetical protein [Flammeovirgaceae bacterium SG7u.132]WPO36155.1 hypothetical protein R9C00_01695 [Flammeovirgaceae bacterium SG7u.111]
MTPRLFFISLLLFCASCSTSKQVNTHKVLPKSFLDEASKGVIFRTTVDFKDYHFSGLVVVKPDQKGIHIRFMSELGPTVMAFRLTEEKMEAIKLLEQLQKDVFLTQLENDFRLLLMANRYYNGEVIYKKRKKEEMHLAKVKGKETHRFWLDETRNRILKAERKSTGVDKVMVDYTYEASAIPKTIVVEHKIAGLRLKLTNFK